MNLREAYRSWADQHPQESRWVAWIWVPAAVALGVGVWAWIGNRAADRSRAVTPPAAQPAASSFGAAVEHQIETDFPADPEIWRAAAQQLPASERLAASKLFQDADLFAEGNKPARAQASVVNPAIKILLAEGIPAALQWLDRAPAGTDSHLSAFRADLLARRRLLPDLKAALNAGAWGPIDEDTLDLGFAAAAARDRQNSALERDLWIEAIRFCGANPARLQLLERLALGLDLDQETSATFEAEMQASGNLASIQRCAVWAENRDPRLWQKAIERWRLAAPSEADAYARGVRQRRSLAS